LKGDFNSRKIILAGNYGLEIAIPDHVPIVQEAAQQAVPFLKQAREKLASMISPTIGAILEDHGYSLCLHYHLVPGENVDEIHRAIRNIAPKFPQLELRSLPTSYEFMPRHDWNKASALAEIAKKLELEPSKTAFFFAGDTTSDEPCYRWVNERDGLSINVGDKFTSSSAQFQLSSPAQLCELLVHISTLP
jgi:trehalose-phosphatase